MDIIKPEDFKKAKKAHDERAEKKKYEDDLIRATKVLEKINNYLTSGANTIWFKNCVPLGARLLVNYELYQQGYWTSWSCLNMRVKVTPLNPFTKIAGYFLYR